MSYDPKEVQDHVADVLFRHQGRSDHLTHSFATCISEWIPRIIVDNGKQCSAVSAEGREHSFQISCPRFVMGLISPQDAITFHSDYAGRFTCTVAHSIDGKVMSSRHLDLCDFPLMIGALELSEATGPPDGCFVIHGKLKSIPLVKTALPNFPILGGSDYELELRSLHLDKPFRSTSTIQFIVKAKKNNPYYVHARISFMKQTIPVAVIVAAMGFTLEQFKLQVKIMAGQQYDTFVFQNYLAFLDCDECKDEETALLRIATDMKKAGKPQLAKHLIQGEIFPHLNFSADVASAKFCCLADVFARVVLFKAKVIPSTDRDDRENVRVVDPATALAQLFRVQFIEFMRQACRILRSNLAAKKVPDVDAIFNRSRIKIVQAVANGKFSKRKLGVSQNVITTNRTAVDAALRSINSDLMKREGMFLRPRHIHSSQIGFECACETPHGHDCGLKTALASTSRITTASDSNTTMSVILRAFPMEPVVIGTVRPSPNAVKVFNPDGALSYWCQDVHVLLAAFYALRQALSIDPTVTCSVNDTDVRFMCDGGRYVRPLINAARMQDAASCESMAELMVKGCVEYFNPAECKRNKLSYRYQPGATHLEITDTSFVGPVAESAPFFTHNQGPRTVYQTNMAKQAVWSNSTPAQDASASMHKLWYGQVPLVQTKGAHQMGSDKDPSGFNCVVILYPLPDNEEDAIVVSKDAIDRGMGTCSTVRKYSVETKTGNRNERRIENPCRAKAGLQKNVSYDTIRNNGIPAKGALLNEGSVVIGMTVPVKKTSSGKAVTGTVRTDASVQAIEAGRVGKISRVCKPGGDVTTVEVETVRIPCEGDKFASRHAQKGVIGRVVPQCDLPFSEHTGMGPDIVMNPIGIGSRMTMGLVLEFLFGKASAICGEFMGDDQDFHGDTNTKTRKMQDILVKAGFSCSGKESFICGKTGERIQAPLMCGIVHYMRLQHVMFFLFLHVILRVFFPCLRVLVHCFVHCLRVLVHCLFLAYASLFIVCSLLTRPCFTPSCSYIFSSFVFVCLSPVCCVQGLH
jgi:DNA-directed RNA polymerase subunit B